jgi:hypothetical protein
MWPCRAWPSRAARDSSDRFAGFSHTVSYSDTISHVKRLRWLRWVPVFLLGVPVLGLGVPVVWLWVASQLQHTTNGIGALPALVLVLGLPATYLALTALVNRLSGRDTPSARRHRDAWTRSLSAERRQPASTTPMEGVFIATVVVVGFASEVYLLFFASPSVSLGP